MIFSDIASFLSPDAQSVDKPGAVGLRRVASPLPRPVIGNCGALSYGDGVVTKRCGRREGRGQAWERAQHLAAVPAPSPRALPAWFLPSVEGGELGWERGAEGAVRPPAFLVLALAGDPGALGRWKAVTEGGICGDICVCASRALAFPISLVIW